MEDQVGLLQALGFAAELWPIPTVAGTRRERPASNTSKGHLDFLFICPGEAAGTRVSGDAGAAKAVSCGYRGGPLYFAMGARIFVRTIAPSVSIFPPYAPRRSSRSRPLRPAWSSTTSHSNWLLPAPQHLIHGFRRDNLAIEVVRVPPDARFALSRELFAACRAQTRDYLHAATARCRDPGARIATGSSPRPRITRGSTPGPREAVQR